jgi:hypothetical protein
MESTLKLIPPPHDGLLSQKIMRLQLISNK